MRGYDGPSVGDAESGRPHAGHGRRRGSGAAAEGGPVGGTGGGVELLDELPPPGQSPAGLGDSQGMSAWYC